MFAFKRKFIQKKAISGVTQDAASRIDGAAVQSQLEMLFDEPLTEKSFVDHVSRWMEEEAPHPEHLKIASDYAAWAALSPAGRAKYPGLHALRHFYASWCINRRVDGGLELPLKIVQTRMGHASVKLTADTYSHLFPRGDDGAELAAAERAFLGG